MSCTFNNTIILNTYSLTKDEAIRVCLMKHDAIFRRAARYVHVRVHSLPPKKSTYTNIFSYMFSYMIYIQ